MNDRHPSMIRNVVPRDSFDALVAENAELKRENASLQHSAFRRYRVGDPAQFARVTIPLSEMKLNRSSRAPRDKHLAHAEFVILVDWFRAGGRATVKEIAEGAGCSHRTVQRALKWVDEIVPLVRVGYKWMAEEHRQALRRAA